MTDQTATTIREAIAANPMAALEDIARAAGVATREVLENLPDGQARCAPGGAFVDIMQEMTGWGDVTFIVNTPEVIAEVKGPVPSGNLKNGFYNLHGKSLAGHLRADRCAVIAFVERKFMGIDTMSVQFYAESGACMFKVYLGRDEKRQLIPAQIAAFRAARDRFAAGSADA
ncbi:heme utilization cystosolic carrier protein HutX [Tropicimonas sp.]|uniref:heme utilization cystosolic carrier protein HutX n=1 Tax=Tropicimonas sp. TaxID=2067044 RepID=UPI003A89D9CF